MYSKDQLAIGSLSPLKDQLFDDFKNKILTRKLVNTAKNYKQEFIEMTENYFQSSSLNTLSHLDQLSHRDITIGCHHFIDNLISRNGIENIQIFEHDYKYYSRLNPKINYSTLENLNPNKPLVIAAPFPGALDLHNNWKKIIDECNQKNISVHIDAAWLSAARDIQIDLSQQCIKSICISLSKGLGLSWNRIGVRWSREYDKTDSISIMNQFNMIPELLIRTGILALNTVPVDYLWIKHHQEYHTVCRSLYLRPTKIVHAAMSIDRKIFYGLENILI